VTADTSPSDRRQGRQIRTVPHLAFATETATTSPFRSMGHSSTALVGKEMDAAIGERGSGVRGGGRRAKFHGAPTMGNLHRSR